MESEDFDPDEALQHLSKEIAKEFHPEEEDEVTKDKLQQAIDGSLKRDPTAESIKAELLRAKALKKQEEIQRLSLKNHQDALQELGRRGGKAEDSLILNFVVGGMQNLDVAAVLEMRAGSRLGTMDLYYSHTLVAIRTAESAFNPVFLHLPSSGPESVDQETSSIIKRLVNQLTALSKAHVSVSADSLRWYQRLMVVPSF